MNNCYGILLLPSGLTTSLQRLWDVYTTSAMSYRHLTCVETTSCVYWVTFLFQFVVSVVTLNKYFSNGVWFLYLCENVVVFFYHSVFMVPTIILIRIFRKSRHFQNITSLFWMNNIYLGNCWGRNTERFVIVIDF